jgi:hypothetical protein
VSHSWAPPILPYSHPSSQLDHHGATRLV